MLKKQLKKWKGASPDTLKLISNGNTACQALFRDTMIIMFNRDGSLGISAITVFGNKNVSDKDMTGTQITDCNTIPINGDLWELASQLEAMVRPQVNRAMERRLRRGTRPSPTTVGEGRGVRD